MFSNPKPVVGMIHVGALPGTPAARLTMSELVAQAASEARTYRQTGVDGVMVENMHDTPYLRGEVGPEIVAAMTIIAQAVKTEAQAPVGVQILAGANLAAMAVAHAAGLDFIRAEGFAFAHVADEGMIESSAAALLRYRRMIGADRVQVWADIKKKHASHAITADIGLGETAQTVEFMRGDAVIVTGSATGDPPRPEDLEEAKTRCRLPVWVGSGTTPENVERFFPFADGFIVGSHFKAGGYWANAVSIERVETFLRIVQKLRSQGETFDETRG